MSGISDRIESFILELLKEDDDWLELGRNELASVFNCVPSQINYVISTRFTPDKGYMVESRRGGGGFLKIRRIITDKNDVIYNSILKVTDKISEKLAKEIIENLLSLDIIDQREARLMNASISDKTLKDVENNEVIRAVIMKNMLGSLL